LAKAIESTGEAWAVSIPGADRQLRLEILADSVLPDVLAEQYQITRGHNSTRIINGAVSAEVIDSGGHVVRKTFHAGEVPVTTYFLLLPE
jgi:hypothetical protein